MRPRSSPPATIRWRKCRSPWQTAVGVAGGSAAARSSSAGVGGAPPVAGHLYHGASRDDLGYFGHLRLPRNVSAVTAACLAVRREAYLAVGGLDAERLTVAFNDVDFCLKLRAAGLAVLYEPRIALLHYESKSRGHDDADPVKQERAEAEQSRLLQRWGEALLLDPGWNPHWSRWTRPFAAIREPSPVEIARHLAASCAENPWRLEALAGGRQRPEA
jgi:hypothetical protein